MSLLVERKGRVLHVSLNRPEKRNALDLQTCTGIVNAVKSVQEDGRIGSILIDAVGPVFCSGIDLDEALQIPPDQLSAVHEELFNIGCISLKPIVVSVNGSALSGGFGLAAQGHIVLVAEGAVFGLTEVRIGFWPFAVYRSIEAAIGSRRTLELSLMGRVIHAQDALNWGLAQQVSPPFELADRAMAIARDLAKSSPAAISAGLRYRRDSQGKSKEEAKELAKTLRAKLIGSDDFKEGCAAFKERRDPHWPSMPEGFYRRKPSFWLRGSSEEEGSPEAANSGAETHSER